MKNEPKPQYNIMDGFHKSNIEVKSTLKQMYYKIQVQNMFFEKGCIVIYSSIKKCRK